MKYISFLLFVILLIMLSTYVIAENSTLGIEERRLVKEHLLNQGMIQDFFLPIDINGCQIYIKLGEEAVQIDISQATLNDLLKNSREISERILEEYKKKFHQNFEISLQSFQIEFEGHVLTNVISLELINTHTKIIDIGTDVVDSNRWIWDFFSTLINMSRERVGVYR